MNNSHIRDLIGEPPHPDQRLDAQCNVCGARHFSDKDAKHPFSAICRECDFSNQYVSGNECKDCPPDSKPVGDTCVPCPDNGHFNKTLGDCVTCPDGTGWNYDTEICEPCRIDKRIYMEVAVPPGTRCSSIKVNASQEMHADDVCPNELWIEVKQLDHDLEHSGGTIVQLKTEVENAPSDPMSCSEARVSSSIYSMPSGSNSWNVFDQVPGVGDWGFDGSCIYVLPPSTNLPKVTESDVENGMTSVLLKSTCKMGNTPEHCTATIGFYGECNGE